MKQSPIPRPGDSWYDIIVLICVFASGFLALVYEVCWIRKASLVFGTVSFALSAVLAVFFAGLALGSYVFGKLSGRVANPLRWYAALELAVGILAVLSPVEFGAADHVFGWFYVEGSDDFTALSITRLGLIAVVLLPPTFCMGGTLPLLCRQYVVNSGKISRWVSWLYGINTLGAAAGCAFCGFILIRYIGVNVSIYLAACVNVVVAAVLWMLSGRCSPPAAEHTDELGNAVPSLSPRRGGQAVIVHVLFFLTGFVALGYEVLWARFLSLLTHNTVYTYTLTLTAVLCGIVLGSVLTGWKFDGLRRRGLVFGSIQVLNGVTVLGILTLPADVWRRGQDMTLTVHQLWFVLCIFLPPAVLSGISFPLAIRMVVDDARLAGLGVGRMSALNTVGGILGSLVTGLVLLPTVGLHSALWMMTGTSVLVGVSAWLTNEQLCSRRCRTALTMCGVSAWSVLVLMTDVRLPDDFLARRNELVDYREGVSSNVAVILRDDVLVLEMDRLWQGQNRRNHQILAAHLPALLHHDPKQVLVVGLGAGQTAQRFLMYPIQQLDCVDVEAQLIPIVRKYFDGDWLDDGRVRMLVEDGRNFIAHSDQQYDIISIEVGQAFRPGVGSFYTAEFYRQVRQRLQPDGLISQFVSLDFFNPEQLRTVVRTFVQEFPQAVLWYNRAEFLLIGCRDHRIQLSSSRLGMLRKHDGIRQDLDFFHWDGAARPVHEEDAFLATFVAGPDGLRRLSQEALIYFDDRPFLEYEVTVTQNDEVASTVKLLESCTEPVGALLGVPIESDRQTEIDNLRRQNLHDIVANDLVDWAIHEEIATQRFQQAEATLREALKWNPDNRQSVVVLAWVLANQGSHREAVSLYRRALRQRDDAAVHQSLADTLRHLGEFEEAYRHEAEYQRLRTDRVRH